MLKFICGFVLIVLSAASLITAYGDAVSYQYTHMASSALFSVFAEIFVLFAWASHAQARSLKAQATCFGILFVLQFVYILYFFYNVQANIAVYQLIMAMASAVLRKIVLMFVWFWLLRPWRLEAQQYLSKKSSVVVLTK